MYIINYSDLVHMARMHDLASAFSPYERVPNSLRYTLNQRTIGPVNAHLISWPSKAQNIQNLEKYMVKK